jgi:uncharacterized protein YjiS (DUF1127 family)
MEMTMSIISNTATRRIDDASGLIATATAAVKGWWMAYLTRRIEQAAIAQLESMSDWELKDIGLTRSEVARAVRGGAGNHPFGQYC